MSQTKQFKTVDEYLSTFPPYTKEKLTTIREFIQNQVPEAEETISYNIPTFKLNGTYLIYFAGYKNHLSIYPIPAVDQEFGVKLLKYVKGKGTLQFPLNEPVPFDIIKGVLEYRLKENMEKAKNK